ncbi:hypothetical protein TW83_08075 [Paracoccus sp. S4493]|uniref:hypothetical protein n=1 Tax=Paracoccus sp. S4493 TaxID=579490 RepID=UPI0005FA3F47|nr:hypothetical protein [Paracoccus sp. S4493]KJZ31604.1 hypothetical protein TW83_08075 [Paracoccus sp. S4493]
MTDRPILFSGPMIRALLDGRKTQTRRVITKKAAHNALAIFGADFLLLPGNVDLIGYAPSDRLWVKEGWNSFAFSEDGEEAWPTKTIPSADEMAEIREAAYRVDVQAVYRESDRARQWFADQKWRPSIHMPRWASRLTLTVTDVRVQRLQDISGTDAIAEGIDPVESLDSEYVAFHARTSFEALWDSLNADRAPWDSNPWVVAITFTVQRGNIEQLEAA